MTKYSNLEKNFIFCGLGAICVGMIALIIFLIIENPKQISNQSDITVTRTTDFDNDYTIIEITHDSHTHEFVKYAGMHSCIEHWPDCKYCKQEQNVNKL